jgi:hypothetical protein
MSVTFTASTLGPTASSFSLTSSSGVTGSGASSPLTLQEAATGTYTYSVSGVNANGTGPSSAASNSVVVASLFAPSGAYDSIATTTLATTASSITFSSIPATYTHLQIRLSAASSTSQDIFFQLNGDTGNNYTRHYMYGSGSGVAAGNTVPINSGSLGYISANTDTNIFGTAVFDLLDYANTNKYKTSRSLTGYDNNGGGLLVLYSGLWQNTAAVTSISLFPNNSGLFQTYTKAALYGIKGA